MASYINLLQQKEETLITAPAFGWSQDKKGTWGSRLQASLSLLPVQRACPRPPDGAENYRVMGDEQVWIDLMKHIVTTIGPT